MPVVMLLFLLMLAPSPALAQGMMGNWISSQSAVSDDHTASEEAEGKEVWEKLQEKQLECKNLSDDNYEVLGEYFMGQSIGNTKRHTLMNQMMISMMGEGGEKQTHIVLGKKYSGCDADAQVPQNGWGFMPMMWMMGGGNPMMGYGWNGPGLFGWMPMLFFWTILVLGVIILFRYLGRSGQQHDNKTPLDILKERYARGEINKKEFEEKKKDVS